MFLLDTPTVLSLIVPTRPITILMPLLENTMNHDHTAEHTDAKNPTGNSKKLIGAVIMLGLIGGFFLLREHWSHIAGYWPYLLLLACPLLHLFHGHGGHGSHGGGSGRD
jgi:hypothetical protein